MAKKKDKEETIEEVVEDVLEEQEIIDEVIEETLEEKLQKEVIELKDKYLRNHADTENFKKRLTEERIRERKYASMDVCKALLTPLDNFDLALKQEVKDDVQKNFLQGFKMIEDQLYNALKDQGAVEVDALNKEYDPNYHQAIMTEKIEGTEPGMVTEVLQKGYMFKDRLLRPSIVKISE